MRHSPLILFGGVSEERLVSVASAQNLSQQIPEALLWFIGPTGEVHELSRPELLAHAQAFTRPLVPRTPAFAGSLAAAVGLLRGKTVLMALHGTEGEDGTIQTLFETHRIPFTGSGSVASRRAFDKKATKLAAAAAHLPVTQDLLVENPASSRGQETLVDFHRTHPKLVLKPVANGSSVGLFIVKDQASFEQALAKLRQNSAGPYMAERFLEGREITVGVEELADGSVAPLPCSEVRVNEGRQFDYEGKYLGSGVLELTPAPLDAETAKRCQELACALHRLMGCQGYSRTDMILTDRGPVLLEINTLPGLSRASFIPQQLAAQGRNLREFFLAQMELAARR